MQKYIGRAKINVTLEIVGVSEGKHCIDSVFYPTDVCDRAWAERADSIEITYTDGRRYENDVAYRAAERISARFGGIGLKMRIEKGIPEKAGLGGSSVDAGLAIRAMRDLYSLPTIEPESLLPIGSDVPYFVRGGVCRVRGLGERTEEIRLPKLYGLILVPDSGVDTGECYRLYDRIGGDSGSTEAFLEQVGRGIVKPFNALQRAGERLNEKVSEGLRVLEGAGFIACMTGSGSATYGITTDRDAFEEGKKRLIGKADGFTVYAI